MGTLCSTGRSLKRTGTLTGGTSWPLTLFRPASLVPLGGMRLWLVEEHLHVEDIHLVLLLAYWLALTNTHHVNTCTHTNITHTNKGGVCGIEVTISSDTQREREREIEIGALNRNYCILWLRNMTWKIWNMTRSTVCIKLGYIVKHNS